MEAVGEPTGADDPNTYMLSHVSSLSIRVLVYLVPNAAEVTMTGSGTLTYSRLGAMEGIASVRLAGLRIPSVSSAPTIEGKQDSSHEQSGEPKHAVYHVCCLT